MRALIGVVFGTGLAGLGAVASALDQPKFTRTSQSAPALLCEAYSGTPDRTDRRRGLVWIEGGSFQMGSDRFYPEERPAHQASVDGFWIDRHPVTNAQFGTFASATGYLTQVERGLDPIIMPGIPDSARVPGSLVFVPPKPDGISGQWRFVPGANWRYPEGPGSSIAGRENHPVVHVTYEDAFLRALGRSRVADRSAIRACGARRSR